MRCANQTSIFPSTVSVASRILQTPQQATNIVWDAIGSVGYKKSAKAADQAWAHSRILPRPEREPIAVAAATMHEARAVDFLPIWRWVPAPSYKSHLYRALYYYEKAGARYDKARLHVLDDLLQHMSENAVDRTARRMGFASQMDHLLLTCLRLLAALLERNRQPYEHTKFIVGLCKQSNSREVKRVLMEVVKPAAEKWIQRNPGRLEEKWLPTG